MLTSWKSWCRLCAEEKALLKLESVRDVNAVIGNFFNVSLIEIKGTAANICEECLGFVNKLEHFEARCHQTNQLFTYLAKHLPDETHPLDLKQIRSKYLDEMLPNDGDEELFEVLEAESERAKELLSIDPVLETHDIQELGKVADDNTEVLYQVESLTVSSVQNELENNANETEQWEMLEVDMDDCSNGLETNDENLEEEEFDKFSDSDYEPETSGSASGTKRDEGKGKDDSESPIDGDDESVPAKQPQKRRYTTTRGASPNQQVHQCKYCRKTFKCNSQLTRHEYIHLTQDGKPRYSCEICRKVFTKSSIRRAHMRMMHEGAKPYMCEECGKPFSSKGALKEHYIVHSEERPFKCAYCPKSFKNAPRLKTHEDTHNDTLYVCPHCGLKLNTKRTLNMHMVVHSDQKKFKCQECGNEYKRSKALKAHLILHTGLRPYQCPFCDKTFANGSNCRSHKKKFHPRELAALEAAGGQKPAANIPKLEHLQRKSQSDGEGVEITRKHIRSTARASNSSRGKERQEQLTLTADEADTDGSPLKSELKMELNV
uniref:zinc finger protein weckle-like n=1 Tax=Anopheles coluzzii TaxID=1518534 RepID=UPI0020FFBBA1|nr:zinc finger protein weckle-like [Anopheles coluzzii]